jgi:hypothetical protein
MIINIKYLYNDLNSFSDIFHLSSMFLSSSHSLWALLPEGRNPLKVKYPTRVLSYIKDNQKPLEGGRDWANGNPNLVLNPWWVTGITDGEGSFSVSMTHRSSGDLSRVRGPKINVTFKIDQKEDSAGILYDVSRFFECGTVVVDNRGYKSFKVSNIDLIINHIIPHFDKYPLITSKQLNYLSFKSIVLLLKKKEHLTTDGFNVMTEIWNTMNTRRTFLDKWKYLNTINNTIVDPHWLQAFIDGEGSFQFGIATRISRGRPYVATTPTLEIGQNTHDVLVLKWIKDFFEAGYLKPKFDISNIEEALSVRGVSRYILRDSDLIISFVDKYPMLTRKQEDYLIWKKLVQLKKERAFDTEEGLNIMKTLKSTMNSGKYK